MDEPATWRLRDLRGRDRTLALVTFGLTLVPFVVALVRAFQSGWVPSGDEANIATRSLDVFSRHPPLTGLSTTTGAYGKGIVSNHPGPFEFYLIAAPIRLLGRSAGPLLTAAVINASFVVITLWVVLRRAGPTVMLWAAVVMQAVMWSAGTAILTDTLSSNMTLYSVLCTSVLAWALAIGDYRLLPLAALVASYAAQQHLAAGVIVAAVVGVAVVALAAVVVVAQRRGRQVLPWATGALVVAGVCWAPVIVDQLTGDPGNLTAIVRFARDDTRPTLGLRSGVTQVVRAITPPTILGRTDTRGSMMARHTETPRQLVAVLVVLAVVAVVVLAARRRRALAGMAGITLVVFAAGVVNGGNVPRSEEMWRINLYRWTWTAAFLTFTTLGWALAIVVRRRFGAVSRVAPVALVGVAALIATSTVFVRGADDDHREQWAFDLEGRVASRVLDRLDPRRPVVVVYEGTASQYVVGPALVFRLVQAGRTVELPRNWASAFAGKHRAYRPGPNTSAVVVASGRGAIPKPPGTRITLQWFEPERARLLDELAAEARGQRVELAPEADAIIERVYGRKANVFIDPVIRQFATDARSALARETIVDLLRRGAFRSPRLDGAKLQRLAEVSKRHVGGRDEWVEVYVLDPRQLRETPPSQLR